MESQHDRTGFAGRRRLRRWSGLALALALIGLSAGAASAQDAPRSSGLSSSTSSSTSTTTEADSLAALRAEIDAMRSAYEAKIAALEARLAALEAAGEGAPAAASSEAPSADDELAALRAAAAEAAGDAASTVVAGAPAGVAGGQPTSGRSDLNRLNPEISFTGDFVGLANIGSGDARDEFSAREFELDFQSALDPYSRTRWTLAFTPEGEVDIEEGYINYTALPGGLGLNVGKFRQQFGVLNRQHAHALPQSDYPLVLQTFFGEEGLAQTGLSGRWLLPHPWASANEVTVEITDGESEAFGGASFQDFAGLAHLKNYWDLGPAAYLEWGLSGAVGKSESGQSRQIWGTDFTFHWQPPSRAKYRELTWRTELLMSDLGLAGGGRDRAWGGYTYGEGLIAQNLYAGARFDWVEDPLDPGHRTWGVVPYLTWWQSEYVRLRVEYRHFEDSYPDDGRADRSDDGLLLQVTWAAGPHKHETY